MAGMTKAMVNSLIDVSMSEKQEVLVMALAAAQRLVTDGTELMGAAEVIARIKTNTKPAAEALTTAVILAAEALNSAAALIMAAAGIEVSLHSMIDGKDEILNLAKMAAMMEQEKGNAG